MQNCILSLSLLESWNHDMYVKSSDRISLKLIEIYMLSLGLKGSQDEIEIACNGVDTDGSGVVDKMEFISAIKGARVEELSLGLLLTKMDGLLDGLSGFFENYKHRYEEAQAKQKDAFEVLRMSARRRHVLKQQMQNRIEKTVHDIVVQLEKAQGVEAQVDEDYKMYMTLKDTFNAFDKDGSLQLGYEE